MDVHEIQKSLFGFTPTTAAEQTNCQQHSRNYSNLIWTRSRRELAGRMHRLRAFPITGAITGVPMMVVAYRECSPERQLFPFHLC